MTSPDASVDFFRARLFEVGLETPQVAQLAEFYGEALGYAFEDSATDTLGVASDRRLRLIDGTAKQMAYAAYAVGGEDELDALHQRLTSADVAVGLVDHAGFASGALAFCDPDGNKYVVGLPVVQPPIAANDVADRTARIQHIVFASRDAARLLAFFTDVMGFRLSDTVLDDQGSLRTAFVRCSEEHHSLAVFQASEDRLDHHCYEAGNWDLIRDWADHFASRRIPLKWGPGRHGPGNNLFLFIHDPDGNWVEISAELERVEHDRPAGEWPHEERTLNTWGTGLLRS